MRIWVTGLGVVSPLGAGAERTMGLLCQGERAFGRVRLFATDGQRTEIAAEVGGERFTRPAKDVVGWSRTAAMAQVAAQEALEQAGVCPASHDVDLVMGGTTGPMLETEEVLPELLERERMPREVADLIAWPLSITTDFVHNSLGPFRRVRTLSSACSSGATAIMMGALWIVSGRSSRVLVGGADALCRLTFTGFNALGALDATACRPFDRSRGGLSLGEGAAFLVLERDDVALARGASPLAELAGWGAGAEAHHITHPEVDGNTAARVIGRAMREAGLRASDIDYVNAHGTATLLNDPMEIRALRASLGDEMRRIAVSSSKGQIGHSLGAAGAVEASICVLSIAQSRVPPTGGLVEPDVECEANHVIGTARSIPVRAALTNSFGFGGLDSCLLFCRPGCAPEKPAPARRNVRVASAATVGAAGRRTLRDGYRYAESGGGVQQGAIALSDAQALDPQRSRRLGRAERMLCMAMDGALNQPGDDRQIDRSEAGLVTGMASGSLDGVARFLKKVRDKGARFAAPAEFPSLMLSAAAGHGSIYHGLRGPVLSATDAGMSLSSALITALELVETRTTNCMLAAGAVEASAAQFAATRSVEPPPGHALSEGASCLVLVAEERNAGVPIAWHAQWHSAWERDRLLAEMPGPAQGARVITAGPEPGADLQGCAWSAVERSAIERCAGSYEGVDGVALVAAVSLVAAGKCPNALMIASLGERGCAVVFGEP